VLLCFIPVTLFDKVLIPLTTYIVYWLLIPSGAVIINNVITVSNFSFVIVEACVASFAFYLIWLLMLLTKDLEFWKRIGLFLSGAGLIFVMNVVRIIILTSVAVHLGYDSFNFIHFIFWQIVSGIYVAIVWISLVSAFRIKSVPVIDDLKTILKLIKRN